MCGGHCWRTAAVGAEGGNCLKETAEKVGVGRTVIVGSENQVRKEAVGTIGLARCFSRKKAKESQVSYLVEGRYDSQEVHWEVLQTQVSFRRLCIFSSPCTDEGNILHVLEGRSLEVVVKPSGQKRL